MLSSRYSLRCGGGTLQEGGRLMRGRFVAGASLLAVLRARGRGLCKHAIRHCAHRHASQSQKASPRPGQAPHLRWPVRGRVKLHPRREPPTRDRGLEDHQGCFIRDRRLRLHHLRGPRREGDSLCHHPCLPASRRGLPHGLLPRQRGAAWSGSRGRSPAAFSRHAR